MPTGSGKTPLYGFLNNLIEKVRISCNLGNNDPTWRVDDASFEKLGAMMSDNNSKLLGLCDELSTFLTQINIYRGRGISDSHHLSTFLSLYNAKLWNRDTGIQHKYACILCIIFSKTIIESSYCVSKIILL